MTVTMIITAVLIAAGLLFMLASLIGIAALPDFFTRLHAQGIGDTIGAFLILAGMMVAVHGGLLSVKIFFIFIIIVLTNPIGTNLMMIAAINKEDYLGYRTRMSAGKSEEKPAATADPEEKTADDRTDVKAAAEMPDAVKKAETAEAKDDKKPASDKTEADNKKEKSAGRKKKPADRKPDKQKEERKSSDKPKPKKESKPAGKPEHETEENKASEKKTPEKKAPKKKRRRKPSMNMNKAELLKAAENRGIKVPEEATKREILELIYADRDK